MADRTWDSINRSVINGGPISDGSDYKMMAGKSSKELLDEALDQRHREFIGGNQFKDIQKVFNRENELNLSDEEILEITKQIFRKKVINQNISEEEVDEILEKIPLTQQEIDLYVTLGDDRAALEEDNRKILAKRAWESELR